MCLVLLGLPSAWASTPTPAGTLITLHASLTWKSAVLDSTTTSHVSTITTTQITPVVSFRTPSSVAFLTYAPGSGTSQPAGPTVCNADGLHTMQSQPMPAPVSAQGTQLDPDSPLPLGPAELYYPGDPVFVQVTDRDQNLDATKRETVDVTVQVSGTSQQAHVRITETSVNSGVFTGYVLTTRQDNSTAPCTLSVKSNQSLTLSYTDPKDATDHSDADALISPYNIVFDDTTGQPINGAGITLVNAQTGQPASVIGRDGVSPFPSSVISGKDVTDSSGADYQATIGAYLLPEVPPGTYRLEVTPPAGYRFATDASASSLQKLPGAPFTLGPASFGKTFTLTHAQAIGFDIPLAPVSTHLFVQKSTSQALASVGDMLQFTVTVENTDTQLAAADVRLVDTLPQGFRYVAHSARVRGVATTPDATPSMTALEPTISADGQQLTFALGSLAASTQMQITYVTAVSAATPLGTATNLAQGFASGGAQSNVANAQVQISNQLMQNVNTLIGRVIIGCDKDEKHPPKGLAGVRILMEDGSYTVTDTHGRYHFPDVINGTHVVQLDTESLPAGYAVEACQQNTRLAGRAYSQFVEVHGGALWHADFHVRILPPPSGSVSLQMSQQRSGVNIDSTLDMAVDTVPVTRLSASVLIPAGSQYVDGSTRLNGQRAADPMVVPGALIFRLDDRAAGWHGKLQFKLTGDKSSKSSTTSVLLNFNTTAASGQHTKPVKVALEASQAQSALQRTPTKGLSPVVLAARAAKVADAKNGTHTVVKVAKNGKKAKANQPQNIHLDAAWFATADSKPEFVLPKASANPAAPAIRVAVKHALGQHVRLSINGHPVSSRNMMGVQVNARKTAAVSGWLSVPLTEGNNLLVAEILKGKNVVKRIQRKVHFSGDPVRAEIVLAKSHLVADGKTRPRLAIRMYDRWGYPVREGLMGHFTLNAPYQSWHSIEQLQGHPLTDTAISSQPTFTIGKGGIAMVELAPTTESGQISIDMPLANNTQQQLRAWMKPGKRDWILVGLATGTTAFNHITGHMQTLSGDDPNKDLFKDGRVAFYAKGMVKGKYLLTLAYDTAKKKGLAPSGLASLGQQIDPNQYFMLYGDASHVGHDAMSNSKLYLKVERGQFNVMFGEFNTNLDVTKLASYSRRFNGLKSQYRGKHFGYTAFAARNAQSFVKDEIQGNGTSGLYHLSHQQILLNSERISLVTRDRYHSEQIVATKPLTRFVDYTIDYTTGAIFFKQPVPNIDENLNPVYIVADYEVTRPGDQAITAGGRAFWHSSSNGVEVGTTIVNEGSQLGDNHLAGVDVRVELGKSTELKAEVAHTRTGAGGSSSQLTGFNPYGSVSTGSNHNSSGLAWRVNVKHQGKYLQGELYARQLDPGFGLGQQSFGEVGMRKIGGDGTYRINEYWQILAKVWHEQSLVDGTSRNAADISARWKGKTSALSLGLRHTDDHYLQPATYGSLPSAQGNQTTPATAQTAPQTNDGSTNQLQLGGSTSFLNNKLTLHANTSQDIAGGSDAAVPSMTTVGADYAVTKSATLFLQQQYTNGGKVAASRMTQFGVRATPWQQAQLQSSIGQQMTEYGPRLFATTGLTQGWKVGKNLALTAGFSQSQSLRRPQMPTTATGTSGPGGIVSVDSNATQPVPGSINPAAPSAAGSSTEDFTSGFLGAAWSQNDWSTTSRVEMLHSTSQQRVSLMAGVYHQLSEGTGMAASLQAFTSDFHDGGQSSQVNLRLSFAHRPDNGAWAFLEQLDLIYGNQQGLSGSPFLAQGSTGIATSQTTGQTPAELATNQNTASTFGINQRTRKLVNNFQANYHNGRFESSLYLGVKYATYQFDSGNYAGLTTLISSESRYDITSSWDAGLVVSRLTTWNTHVSKNGLGMELGHTFGKNMWVSLGYNFTGFQDRDFSGARYTAQGAFVRFRVKFDQDTVKHMLESISQ